MIQSTMSTDVHDLKLLKVSIWYMLLCLLCLQKLDHTFLYEVIVVDDGSIDKTTKVGCVLFVISWFLVHI